MPVITQQFLFMQCPGLYVDAAGWSGEDFAIKDSKIWAIFDI